jgi:uncharacterized protein (DUF2062 family)
MCADGVVGLLGCSERVLMALLVCYVVRGNLPMAVLTELPRPQI